MELAPFYAKERNETLVATGLRAVQKIHIAVRCGRPGNGPRQSAAGLGTGHSKMPRPAAVTGRGSQILSQYLRDGSAFGGVGLVILYFPDILVEHLLGNETGILAQRQFDLIGYFRILLEEQFRVVAALAETLRIIGEP